MAAEGRITGVDEGIIELVHVHRPSWTSLAGLEQRVKNVQRT